MNVLFVIVSLLFVGIFWLRLLSYSKYNNLLRQGSAIKLKRDIFIYSSGLIIFLGLFLILFLLGEMSYSAWGGFILGFFGICLPRLIFSLRALKKRGFDLFGSNNGERLITPRGWMFIIVTIISLIALAVFTYYILVVQGR